MHWMLLALLAGFGGGAWHLWVLSIRACRLNAVGLALAPVGLLGPLGAVLVFALVHAPAVWAVVPGLIAARLVLVPRLARRISERPWTP